MSLTIHPLDSSPNFPLELNQVMFTLNGNKLVEIGGPDNTGSYGNFEIFIEMIRL